MRVDPSLIIKTLEANGGRVRATARQLHISPGTVSNWRKRARNGSQGGRHLSTKVERYSTAPRTTRRTSLLAVEQDAVLSWRRNRGLGARKLTAVAGLSCHYNTVHRFLRARGLTAPGRTYRRPRYQETTHMYLANALTPGKLQMDVKYVTPELSGLVHTCYLYGVMDIWSRYKQGLILPLLDQQSAIESLQYIKAELPFPPDFIQTDNGLEFQSGFRRHVTEGLGWEHHYIHKSNPNENAVIERSFRTDEEEFFWRLDSAPEDLVVLNARYQEYLTYYNEVRPHLGIDLSTPLKRLEGVQ